MASLCSGLEHHGLIHGATTPWRGLALPTRLPGLALSLALRESFSATCWRTRTEDALVTILEKIRSRGKGRGQAGFIDAREPDALRVAVGPATGSGATGLAFRQSHRLLPVALLLFPGE